jgi:hypothetical protein
MGFPEDMAGSGFPLPACKLFAVMGWEPRHRREGTTPGKPLYL